MTVHEIRDVSKTMLLLVAAAILLYAGYEGDRRRYAQAAYHAAQATCLLVMSMCV